MLAAWCRVAKEDVDIARKLDFEQVGISHPVSYIHLEKWPGKQIREFIERMVDVVQYAKEHGLVTFVHGEDSTRADWGFEKEFINAAAEAGASAYRICDTVGCGDPDPSAPLPHGIPAKIKCVKRETKIPCVEIHAHDDLGNAVANTMAAIKTASGLYDKVYVSTTFLGLGDRSGNAETEKVIMNCYFHYNVRKWDLKLLRGVANFITSCTGYRMPVNKAIVGDGAFAHESGIHVHGIETLPLTYEVFPPGLVGQKRRIVIGKRSGKHGVKLKLEEVTGQKIDENDPRFLKLLQIIKEEFVEGRRRHPIEDREFKEYAREVGFEVGDMG
jgi:isopropylmalate/homocitrate/citramalate synthase